MLSDASNPYCCYIKTKATLPKKTLCLNFIFYKPVLSNIAHEYKPQLSSITNHKGVLSNITYKYKPMLLNIKYKLYKLLEAKLLVIIK